MICSWVLHPYGPLIPGASTAVGGGFMIMVQAIWEMTVCTVWIWLLLH